MRTLKSSACSRIIGVLVAVVCVATADQTAIAEPRNSKIDERIKRVETELLPPVLIEGESPKTVSLIDRMAALHVSAVSIALVHEGKIDWARGFGVTKVSGQPVTPHTLFQAASISKPLTALAVLHLAQTGKLNLDADVNEYLKNWKLPTNQFTELHPVTLRGLLTHTAGVTVHGFPGYAVGERVPTPIQVLDGLAPSNTAPIRVDTTPGTLWRYSGGGYVIIQQLLEDVTGQPFHRLMDEIVLAPIGMKESTFEQPPPEGKMKDVATPYRSSGEPVQGGPHIYPERAPAALWTTPTDLARYIIEVQRALSGKSNHVLTPAMAREMLTPTQNYQGLGPRTSGSPPYFQHSGANEGYRCFFRAYEGGDGVVIMTNGDEGSKLFDEILRTIAYEYRWPDFQPSVRGRVDQVSP